RVTWNACFPCGGAAPEATVQVEITGTSILVRYDPLVGAYSGVASNRIVGFSNGVSQLVAPPSSDLDGGAVPPVTGAVNLLTVADSPAFAGGSGVFRTTGIPAGGIGGLLAEIGVAGPGVPPPGAPSPPGRRPITPD